MTLKENLIAGKLTVSEGGGGGGAFVVNIISENSNYRLNKTWREIYNAMIDGQAVLFVGDYSADGVVYYRVISTYDIADVTHDSSISFNYIVSMAMNGTQVMYGCDSENDYPITHS